MLLLDTYEVTGTFLDEWVRALLDEKFGALGREVLVCIAGRSLILQGDASSTMRMLGCGVPKNRCEKFGLQN